MAFAHLDAAANQQVLPGCTLLPAFNLPETPPSHLFEIIGKKEQRLKWADMDDDCDTESTGDADSTGTSGRSPRSDSSDSGLAQGITTLMLRNIPCRCTEAEVLEAIAEYGFVDVAHFMYMPVKSMNGKNLGYAFVGFGDPETADAFKNRVDGINMFKNRKTKKVVSVVPAHIQGLADTLQRFSKCSKGPVLLGGANGSRLNFNAVKDHTIQW